MITPEQFLKEFEEKFPTWYSFQGNKFKNVRRNFFAKLTSSGLHNYF